MAFSALRSIFGDLYSAVFAFVSVVADWSVYDDQDYLESGLPESGGGDLAINHGKMAKSKRHLSSATSESPADYSKGKRARHTDRNSGGGDVGCSSDGEFGVQSRYLSPDRIAQDKRGHLICEPSDVIGHRYMVMRELGEGTFGKVMAVRDLRSPSSPHLALKIVRNKEKYCNAARVEVAVLKEIATHTSVGLSHLCVKMISHFDYHGHVCILFEMLGRSVFDVMKANRYHPFPLNQIARISLQLIRAVEFLHRIRIVHTDLKPENMLFVHSDYVEVEPTVMTPESINKTPKKIQVMRDVEIRLIDFGSAVSEDDEHGNVVTTRHYRAPEVILDVGWTYPCDAWSVGCIMFELYTGITLFQTHSNEDHLAIIERVIGQLPDKIEGTRRSLAAPFYALSDSKRKQVEMLMSRDNIHPLPAYIRSADHSTALLFDLISKLMEFNPAHRLTMSEAAAHPFFTNAPPKLSWMGHPIDPLFTAPFSVS